MSKFRVGDMVRVKKGLTFNKTKPGSQTSRKNFVGSASKSKGLGVKPVLNWKEDVAMFSRLTGLNP